MSGAPNTIEPRAVKSAPSAIASAPPTPVTILATCLGSAFTKARP